MASWVQTWLHNELLGLVVHRDEKPPLCAERTPNNRDPDKQRKLGAGSLGDVGRLGDPKLEHNKSTSKNEYEILRTCAASPSKKANVQNLHAPINSHYAAHVYLTLRPDAAGGNLGWVVDRHTIRVRLSIICGVLSGQLQAVGILHHVEGLSDSQFILQVEFQYSVTTLATCLVLLGMSEGIPFARAELRVLRFDQVVES
ncbi:hypothetical protein PGTUg99_025894 [Puccinia graminis f. sp. tritici]|uniref:Uncharacterized protein n=1 Tax=Puccinia graminis f. sp. tritici TaxID=56615 RepID=A0A5B0SD55_PUCGR|nr:hypothetical protein PGTUg99_025894 [Puccinia graminis f. sp. tritici]